MHGDVLDEQSDALCELAKAWQSIVVGERKTCISLDVAPHGELQPSEGDLKLRCVLRLATIDVGLQASLDLKHKVRDDLGVGDLLSLLEFSETMLFSKVGTKMKCCVSTDLALDLSGFDFGLCLLHCYLMTAQCGSV